MSVIVFGSVNMDLVVRSPRLPAPGETILGSHFLTTPGGKGANQAVALAKLGVPTWMVGRVGGDTFGQELLTALKTAGVQIDWVQVDRENHSGVALITVADSGENQIIGVFGANGQVDETDVDRLKHLLPQANTLILQLEVPLATVEAAAKAAHHLGIRVILDPAPVQTPDLDHLYPFIDVLIPNEVEAGQLVGFPVNSSETAKAAATILQKKGAKTVIVKLGAQGVFCVTPEEQFFAPAFQVEAIDSVAAGDAFAGGLVAALEAGLPLKQAVTWGQAAGALATTKAGAQNAMSDRPTFDAFLQQYNL